jgi:hypothetical protein
MAFDDHKNLASGIVTNNLLGNKTDDFVNALTGGNIGSATIRRVNAITQSATPAINTDITDVASMTGIAQNITSMTTNLTGTAQKGDMLY